LSFGSMPMFKEECARIGLDGRYSEEEWQRACSF
jgi:hypothetical protein